MEVITAKTVRFGELVKKVGSPSPVTLWTAPEKNPEVQQAIRQNRILTIKQSNVGSKADYGVVGFHPGKNATFLIFAKPLSRYGNSRVIGIKYDLIETPPVQDPAPLSPATHRRVRKSGAKAKAKPEPKPVELPKFMVSVACIATTGQELNVTATDSADAKKKALEIVQSKPFPLQDSEVTYRVRKVTRASKQ